MKNFWVSSPKLTVWVDTTDDLVIHDSAPIVKKFIGQPFRNLTKWMQKQGFVKIKQLLEKTK